MAGSGFSGHYKMQRKNICKNCKWFELEEFSDEIGFCTRYPPIFQSKQVKPNEHVSNVSEWPTVVISLSCGEFKEKIEYKPSPGSHA